MPEGDEQQTIRPGDFACHLHIYLRQFIQAADQKAAFTLAASSAVLGFLISRLSDSHCQHSICFWLIGSLGAVSLVIAGALAALSVRPRQNDVDKGLVAWVGILKSVNADEYISSVKDVDRTEEILKHCYKLSAILRRKYALLKCSIDFFMAGSAVTVVFLIIAIAEKGTHP